MQNEFRELRIKQLERTLAPFQSAAPIPRPHKGWVRAIREALGLSSGDMAAKMGTSRQLIIQQENADPRIASHSRACALSPTLSTATWSTPSFREAAVCPPLRPRKRATGREINVIGVEHSMAIESQASGHVDEAIEAEARRLARKRSIK